MPAETGKQYRFMAGIAHGMKPRTGIGPGKEFAEEMVEKTPSKKRSLFMKKGKKPMKKSLFSKKAEDKEDE